MNQFIVSARKYRPATFNSVVGQRHIAETLKNAIKSGHLAQAFLFSGPRGVGKTTCARILAKTINCTNRNDKVEACDECQSCKSFNEGHSLNIYELDAASNNSVEDIRALIEQVRFAPQIGTKKVYIIDEVHMLSQQAFNAFLKTLEEPPSHAIFILATTEKHKIIPTILSRCQVFDFNRIDIEEMIRHLENIASQEGVEAEVDALHLIAQKSDGSLRDALSMFDQMVTYSGDKLTYQSLVENLSILGADYFFTLTDHLVASDIASSLLLFNDVLQRGFDGHNFLLSYAEHLRNLLVAQDHSTIELLTAGEQMKGRYRDQTVQVSSDWLIKALNLVSRADVSYKTAKNQRLLVELTLINLASMKSGEPGSRPAENKVPTSSQPKKKVTEPEAEVKSVAKPVRKVPEEIKSSEPVEEKKAEASETVESEVTASAATEEKEVEVITEEAPEPAGEREDKEEGPKQNTHKEIIEQRTSEPVKPAADDIVEKKEETGKGRRRYDPGSMSDTVSISAFTDEKKSREEHKEVSGPDTERKEKVSQADLEKVWQKMAENYQEGGRMAFYTTLTKYKPQLSEDQKIIFTYDNASQLESLKEELQGMLQTLRNGLRNDELDIVPTLSDSTYQKPYTPAEKLEKLIEKNPSINSLRNKLDLDIGQ